METSVETIVTRSKLNEIVIEHAKQIKLGGIIEDILWRNELSTNLFELVDYISALDSPMISTAYFEADNCLEIYRMVYRALYVGGEWGLLLDFYFAFHTVISYLEKVSIRLTEFDPRIVEKHYIVGDNTIILRVTDDSLKITEHRVNTENVWF